MKLSIELTEKDIKALVCQHLREKFGSAFDEKRLKVEVKSKQNYKSEWETAAYRAVYESED